MDSSHFGTMCLRQLDTIVHRKRTLKVLPPVHPPILALEKKLQTGVFSILQCFFLMGFAHSVTINYHSGSDNLGHLSTFEEYADLISFWQVVRKEQSTNPKDLINISFP